MKRLGRWAFVVIVVLAACTPPPAIPTQTNIEMAQTASFQTENAPPPGFDVVSFAPIDKGLEALPHYHYTVSMRFEGVFADNQQPAEGTLSAEVYANPISAERRVILRASGTAFELAAARNIEGVRLGNAFYFVDQNGVCSPATDDPNRRRAAELTAGDLVGGVGKGTPTYGRKSEGGLNVWQYTFTPADLTLPQIAMTQGGQVRVASGELWAAPSLNVAWQYALTLEIESVIVPVFQNNRQLTGRLFVDYTLIETGTPYNIAIPFGC